MYIYVYVYIHICILVCVLTHEGVCDSWCVDIVDQRYICISIYIHVYMYVGVYIDSCGGS